jgi:hypothetical protein
VETTPSTGGAIQILLLLALVVPAIFFLISQQNTLKAVKPENRLMQPGLVWLQLIPFFSNIWQFFVVVKIAGSIQRELASRHDDSIFGADALLADGGVQRPTQGIGIAYGVLYTIVTLFALAKLSATTTAGLFAWGMIICWIIYWVQLARFKNKLKRGLV